MKKTALLLLFAVTSSMLFAGPFGLEFGWTAAELEENCIYAEHMITQGSMNGYLINPPNPHSELKMYVVFVDDEYGLYLIRALTASCYTEHNVRWSYDMLKNQLSSVYGEPEEVDEIEWNSDWKGSDNFLRSIFYGDRILLSVWQPAYAEGSAKDIYLTVMPGTETEARVDLEYYSWDYDAVAAKFNNISASVL